MISFGYSWGAGYGCSDIKLGGNGMDAGAGMIHYGCGKLTGVDASVLAVPLTGSSTVIESRIEDCDSCKE